VLGLPCNTPFRDEHFLTAILWSLTLRFTSLLETVSLGFLLEDVLLNKDN